VQGWGANVTPLLVLALLVLWGVSAMRALRPNAGLIVWMACSVAAAPRWPAG